MITTEQRTRLPHTALLKKPENRVSRIALGLPAASSVRTLEAALQRHAHLFAIERAAGAGGGGGDGGGGGAAAAAQRGEFVILPLLCSDDPSKVQELRIISTIGKIENPRPGGGGGGGAARGSSVAGGLKSATRCEASTWASARIILERGAWRRFG